MSDQESNLSDQAILYWSAVLGLDAGDDRFSAAVELIERYGQQSASLHEHTIDNGLAPIQTHRVPAPENSQPSRFSFTDTAVRPLAASSADLAFASLSDLAHWLQSGELSPVELAQMYLDRLDSHGGPLHCVVTRTADLALQQARLAEKEITAGEYRGPLHGIPWGAKDLLATTGIPTTWGATPFKDQVFDYDAAVVDRLSEAGAVLVAKLSMGSLAQGPHWFGGMTRNPWDTESGSSGSSAGPGAATAAGLVGFSIGTETHGSIVSPSHTCGVTGIRPTYGRVSRFGAMALGYSLDKIGPMCRSAEDCAAVFAAIEGCDDRDPATVSAPFIWPMDVSSPRVGVIQAEYDAAEGAEADVDRAALEVLRSLGMDLVPVTLPPCPPGLMLTVWVESASAFDDLARSGKLDSLKDEDNSNWPAIFRAARSVSATDYLRAQRIRTQLILDVRELLGEYDAIICPGTGQESMTITNMTGHPALTLPAGFVDGKPRGMTLMGKFWDESTLLVIGHAFQSATSHHTARPPLVS